MNMKRKIDGAILTLTGYYNYGNVIQRYALQEFLKQHGYNFISYVDPFSSPRDYYVINKAIKFKTPLRAIKRFLNYQKPYWYIPKYGELFPEAKGIENIINFVNNNIRIKKFDPNDDYKNYIVGSDQVWRDWWSNREILGYYFFNFLRGKKANRISYAASFGKDKIEEVMNPEDINYIKPYIESFDHISVREKSGIGMIKETWGIDNIQEVVDPSLLLDASDYSKLIEKTDVRYKAIQPIFTYIIGETTELKDFVRKIQDERKQAVSKIRVHAGSEGDILSPVEYWLKGFRDSELVVTNSFHGMMLSIVNNTDFVIVGRKEGGLSRIIDFLSKYGLEERFVDEKNLETTKIKDMKPIDWGNVNRKLKKYRKQSGDWLIESISAGP